MRSTQCFPHVRVHLFGVKSTVLDRIAYHPRVASVNSMAWDFHAERRTGRDMAYRIGHMLDLRPARDCCSPAHAQQRPDPALRFPVVRYLPR